MITKNISIMCFFVSTLKFSKKPRMEPYTIAKIIQTRLNPI